MKLFVIARALELRARRAQAFAGAYGPIEAGPDVCAFTRGDGEVLVVVRVRDAAGTVLDVAPGRYRDVLGAGEHSLSGEVPVGELRRPARAALLERVFGLHCCQPPTAAVAAGGGATMPTSRVTTDGHAATRPLRSRHTTARTGGIALMYPNGALTARVRSSRRVRSRDGRTCRSP